MAPIVGVAAHRGRCRRLPGESGCLCTGKGPSDRTRHPAGGTLAVDGVAGQAGIGSGAGQDAASAVTDPSRCVHRQRGGAAELQSGAPSAELAIRRALGARRRDVFIQLMWESIAAGAASSVLAVVTYTLGIRVVAAGDVLPSAITAMHAGAMLMAAGLGVVTTLLCSLVPSFEICRVSSCRVPSRRGLPEMFESMRRPDDIWEAPHCLQCRQRLQAWHVRSHCNLRWTASPD